MEKPTINWEDFSQIDIRVGTVLEATPFKEAKKPAYKFVIDFGSLGKRKSSAQVTKLYRPEELIGKQIIAVVNFPPKQIANMHSECLILGAVEDDKVTLIHPGKNVKNGLRIS